MPFKERTAQRLIKIAKNTALTHAAHGPHLPQSGSPIRGTTKLSRLKENLGAANVHLTADDLAEIGQVASAVAIMGERYPKHLLATTGR